MPDTANPDVIIKFKLPDPEPEIYPVACVREQGRPVILVRATNALIINSARAKQIAAKAQEQVPGQERNGVESLGGAYCVDTATGTFLQNPPHVKEGEEPPANIRYERKFRLNPSL